MEEKLVTILNEMSEYLSIAQMKKLQEVLLKTLSENEAEKLDLLRKRIAVTLVCRGKTKIAERQMPLREGKQRI